MGDRPFHQSFTGPRDQGAIARAARKMSKRKGSQEPAAAPTTGERLRVCLAASGGGHLRQLLDLQSFWSGHDYFFVTEDTALGQSLRDSHPTYFVPHFGLGQAR